MSFSYRIAPSTVSMIVQEVCSALWDVMSPIHVPLPADEADWKLVAENFRVAWDFPHCRGALDGKHIVMKAPGNTGSLHFNYKQTFSIVLLALVDAAYKFLMVDVGAYGRNSDGGVLSASEFGQALSEDNLHIPAPEVLADAPQLEPLPYTIVADEAFPLKPNIMRPYPGGRGPLALEKKAFNYRVSRARRISENGLGILEKRWRIYDRRINLSVENCKKAVLATVALHNFLQSTSTPLPVPAMQDELQVPQPRGLQQLGHFGFRPGNDAIAIRDRFAEYFSNYNVLPWQVDYLQRGLN